MISTYRRRDAGRVLVEGGRLTLTGVDEVLARHRAAAARLQGAAG
jgi:hypothetical protein